jgi:hypothetical protein
MVYFDNLLRLKYRGSTVVAQLSQAELTVYHFCKTGVITREKTDK